MKFRVKLSQHREGYIDIYAENMGEALKKADELYNQQGKELPDMEDVGPIQLSIFSLLKKEEKEEDREPPEFGRQMVEEYLKRNGWPDPDQNTIDWLLCDGPWLEQRKECVMNNYDLCDAERWLHLLDVLGTDVSFRAAMLVEGVLWENDNDILEHDKAETLISAVDGALRTYLENACSELAAYGALAENTWNVTWEDVLALSQAFGLESAQLLSPEKIPVEPKPALSSLIQSANERSGEKPETPKIQKHPYEIGGSL